MRELVYYSENPKLNLKTVETVSGEKEYRVNCRKIDDKFYAMNKDCHFIEGKWIRVDSGLITFDYETKEWMRTSSLRHLKTVEGIVDFKNNKPVYGRFTPNPMNNCIAILNSMNKVKVLNPDILYDNNFVEDVSRGMFYPKNELSASGINRLQTPINALDHTRKGYNIEDNYDEFHTKMKLFNEQKLSMAKDVRVFSRFLGDTTYGLEIETCRGYLPDFLQYRTGVVVCRDGSLRDSSGMQGAEFVTIPMSGAKGVQNIINLCNELNKRTETDINCSVHVHLGNVPTDRTSLVSIYMLTYKIQNELFEIFPYYKTDPVGFKEKNYNQKLKKLGMYALNEFTKDGYDEFIKSAYERILTFLMEGAHPSASYNRKNKRHPHGDARNKWQLHARYHHLNMLNCIFSTRNTVEFRLHENTTNSTKIINWLYICNAIIKYAASHPREILTTGKKITLNMVMDYYKDTFSNDKAALLSEYLKAYILHRKEVFHSDYEKGDRLSNHWTENDKNYIFEFNGMRSLF